MLCTNGIVNNCELGILANVKLPATSEYPMLSTKYYIYELLWNSRFELNDEWRKWVAVAFCPWPFVRVAFCPVAFCPDPRTCTTNPQQIEVMEFALKGFCEAMTTTQWAEIILCDEDVEIIIVCSLAARSFRRFVYYFIMRIVHKVH